MKALKYISVFFLLISLAGNYGCRKKQELALDYADKPLHCYNSIMDSDETAVDQGGSCSGSSNTLSSSCGLTTNKAMIGTTASNVTSCVKTISGNEFVFTLSLADGGTIVIGTSSNVTYNSLLSYSYMIVSPLQYKGTVTPSSSLPASLSYGDVQIKTIGASQAVEICNGYIGGYGSISVTAFAIVN